MRPPVTVMTVVTPVAAASPATRPWRKRLGTATVALMLAACGGGSSSPGGSGAGGGGGTGVGPAPVTTDLTIHATPSTLAVPVGGRQTVRIDLIDNPTNAAAAYSIGFSETLHRVAITTAPCPPGAGSAACQDWTFVPAADAVPGLYNLEVAASGLPAGMRAYGNVSLEVLQAPKPAYGPATKVAAYDDAVYVLTADGQLYARGRNASLALGRGHLATTLPSGTGARTAHPWRIDEFVPIPVPVSTTGGAGLHWIDVEAQGGRVYAVRSDGALFAWGDYSPGDGLPDSSQLDGVVQQPTQVQGVQAVRAVSTGRTSALVLGDDGLARRSARGFDVIVAASSGQDVVPLTDVIAVDGGDSASLLLRRDGTVWNAPIASLTSSPVAGLPGNVTAIALAQRCNGTHSLAAARTADGQVWWWWIDDLGYAAPMGNPAPSTAPQRLADVRSTTTLTAGCFTEGSRDWAIFGRHADDGTVWRVRASVGTTTPVGPTVLSSLPTQGALFGRYAIDGSCSSGGRVFGSDDGGNVSRLAEFAGHAAGCSTVDTVPLRVTVGGEGRVQMPSGALCSGDCTEQVPVGAPLRLPAMPAAGFTGSGWTRDGAPDLPSLCGGNVPVAYALTCGVTFAPRPPGWTEAAVTIRVSGTGRVVSTPAAIDCGATCDARVPRGTVLSLAAEPAAGWRFARWEGHPDCADGTLTADTARLCTAVFELPPPPAAPAGFTATVTPDGTGIVLAWNAGGAEVTRWQLQRSVAGGAYEPVQVVLGPTVTGFTDAPLPLSTRFDYRLFAIGVGAISPAAQAGAQTPSLPPPIQPASWVPLGSGFAGTLAHPTAARDSAGRPVVAYVERVEGRSTYRTRVQRWTGAAWQDLGQPNPASPYDASYPTLLVEAGGAPVVAWTEQYGDGARVLAARHDGARWVYLCEAIAAAGVGTICRVDLNVNGALPAARPALALDAAGGLAMAWVEGGAPVMKRYRAATNDWVVPAAGAGPSGSASAVALALEADGTPVLAWHQSGSPGAIQVARGAGAWTALPAVPLDAADGDLYWPDVNLLLPAAGGPLVAWAQGSPATARAFVAQSTGTGWQRLGATAALTLPITPTGVQLAALPGGDLVLALGGPLGGAGRITFARWASGAWTAYGTPLDGPFGAFALAGGTLAGGGDTIHLFETGATPRVRYWQP